MTRTKIKSAELQGKFLAIHDGQPVMVKVASTTDGFYMPVFDELEPFAAFLGHSNREWDGFQLIVIPDSFLSSIPAHVVVMVNPRFTDEGKVLWDDVARE